MIGFCTEAVRSVATMERSWTWNGPRFVKKQNIFFVLVIFVHEAKKYHDLTHYKGTTTAFKIGYSFLIKR